MTAEVFDMAKTRKLKEDTQRYETGYMMNRRKDAMEFRPHCYVQRLVLAEAKRFDSVYATTRASMSGDDW